MNDIALMQLRDMLETLIENNRGLPPPLEPLPDKWVAASALQKGIRRGNLTLTLRALDTLWNIDQRYARRRLAIVAFEDVGLGAPDTVAVTVLACSGTKYLAKHKIYTAVRACAAALASSAKERSAEHIHTILAYHGSLDLLRDRFAHKTPRHLVDIMIDKDRFLLERSAAAWLLAGTKRFGAGMMPEMPGDLGAYEWAIEQLSVPLWQPMMTMAGIRVTQCALPIFWPLKLSHKECAGGQIRTHNLRSAEGDVSVPSFALDQFTRGGKAVIRSLLNEDNTLTQWLNMKLPRKAWQPTTEMGLFYLVSDQLDKEYEFAGSDKLRHLAVEADCCRWGLDPEDVDSLFKLIKRNLAEITKRQQAFIDTAGW